VGAMAKKVTIIERRETGPTAERLLKAQNHYHVGDDKQGGRIYQFHDNPLDRLYSRLTRSAGTHEENTLRREYSALLKYKHHWNSAGLEPSVGSVDLNRVFASDASNMSGMAKSERQYDHRTKYRAAREEIGHRSGIVVDSFVCHELPIEAAGYAVGWTNRPQASAAATEMVREAGGRLAKFWGM
jgi:hypothetical protein